MSPTVLRIGSIGFWLLVDDREYFIPFNQYPAFQKATVSQIYAMKQIGPDEFTWPELDIDIELNSLQNPDMFPLAYRP
jgi:hypothetical protein